MATVRSFLRNHSPMLVLTAVIVGLYVMAIFIGVGISLPA